MKMTTNVTKPQIIAVTVLTLVALAAGIFIAAWFGNFNMSPKDMQGQSSFSNSTFGLKEAKRAEMVTLKNGDTYDLTASIVKKNINGKEVKMLAYNGSIPGPTIKVSQGGTITLNFKNNTDIETTLHSHGVRGENQFDGVADVTQQAIPVGGTFTYKLTFPDAGAFWYHPHIREDYTQESGLYGMYLVEPSNISYYSPVNREIPLIVDDILMEDGKVASFNKTSANRTLMGRFGNVMLVNGETGYSLQVKKGEVVRFYIANTANTRMFNIAIPDTKMKLVGSDNGKYEREQFVDSVLLSPSERSIVEVSFDKEGVFNLVNQTPQKTYTIGNIHVLPEEVDASYTNQFLNIRTNSDVSSLIDPLRSIFTKQADKNLTLSLNMMSNQNSTESSSNMMPGHNMQMMGQQQPSMEMGSTSPSTTDKIEWEDTMGEMNKMADTKMVKWKLVDTDTKKENMDINWQFKKGDKVKIKIFNDPKSAHPMQHPIHIHGQRFLVTSVNGVPTNNLVFKDTVLVQNGDTVEVVVDMENPGNWVIHCHIPEHMEAGMMMKYQVI